MINHIHQFIIDNKRRPTEVEVGALMGALVSQEPGAQKSKKMQDHIANSAVNGAKGGREKTPIKLSENALNINNLLRKKFSQSDIALILDMSIVSVKSISKKQGLPRSDEYILNVKK